MIRHSDMAILISSAVLNACAVGCVISVPELQHDLPVTDASVDQSEGDDSGLDLDSDSDLDSDLDSEDTVPSDNGLCGPGQKLCPEGCVPNDDPSFGCADASCTPCYFPNAAAKCSAGQCAIAACFLGTDNCDLDDENGCEADLLSDPLNCSECGRDCRGPCTGGVCEPVQIASYQAKCWYVAVDEHHVYWKNAGGTSSVLRAQKDGAELEVLDTEENAREGALALDDEHVYWVTGATGEIRRKAKAGGESALLAFVGGPSLRGIVLDDVNVYFADSGESGGQSGSIGVVSKQGGSPQILAQDLPDPAAMTADNENIYWTSRSQGSAWKVPKVGGDVVKLAEGSSQSSGIVGWGIVVAETNVYFLSMPLMVRVPTGGGIQEEVYSGMSSGRFMVRDSDRLLWAISGSGAVMMAPISANPGAVPRTLASVAAHGIAFDADFVYWTRWTAGPDEEGGVYRLRKPKDY